MKKLLSAVLFLSMSAGAVFAASQPGFKVLDSTTEEMICAFPCKLISVQLGSGAAASTLSLRDTDTADGGSSDSFRLEFGSGANVGGYYKLGLFSNDGWSGDLSSSSDGESAIVVYERAN